LESLVLLLTGFKPLTPSDFLLLDSSLLGAIVFYFAAAFIAYFFLSGFVFGAGYQNSPLKKVDYAARLANLQRGMLVYDLGSGLGGPLIFLAKKYGVRCVGIEIEPLKFLLSKLNVKLSGVGGTVVITRGNFLDANLAEADMLFLFLSGGTNIMEKVRKKALEEMKPSAKIASYVHSFGAAWPPMMVEGDIRVYSIPSGGSVGSVGVAAPN
jgi:SAM-dependent methyltransferase